MSEVITITEKTVLNYLYHDNTLMDNVEKNYFISTEGYAIYEALKTLYGSIITEEKLFIESNRREKTVDRGLLKDIINNVDRENIDFDYYYTSLRKNYYKKTVGEDILKKIAIITNSKGEIDPKEMGNLLSHLEETYNEILVDKDNFPLLTANDLMQIYLDELDRRDIGDTFHETGDKQLDKMLVYGFAPRSMTTIYSASGIGKTNYKLMLINQRINLNLPTLSIELEMDDVPIVERLVMMRTSQKKETFSTCNEMNSISEKAYSIVKKQKNMVEKMSKKFLSYNYDNLSIDELKVVIRKAKKTINTEHLVVFIDLATMLKDFNEGYGSLAERYEKAVNKLHFLCRSENIHIVNIVQANRQFEGSTIKKPEDVEYIIPKPTSVKNSEAFRERSRALIGLNRKKYFLEMYFPDSPENDFTENILEVWITKQNGGPLGRIDYLFFPEYYQLFNYIDPEEEE